MDIEKLKLLAGDLADEASNLDVALECNQPLEVVSEIAESVKALAVLVARQVGKLEDKHDK